MQTVWQAKKALVEKNPYLKEEKKKQIKGRVKEVSEEIETRRNGKACGPKMHCKSSKPGKVCNRPKLNCGSKEPKEKTCPSKPMCKNKKASQSAPRNYKYTNEFVEEEVIVPEPMVVEPTVRTNQVGYNIDIDYGQPVQIYDQRDITQPYAPGRQTVGHGRLMDDAKINKAQKDANMQAIEKRFGPNARPTKEELEAEDFDWDPTSW